VNRKKGYGPFSIVVAGAALVAACSSDRGGARITPEYDHTGKLQLLKYDANGNGTVDTWSYMDGARVVRIEIDKDEDGKIDRWEYYGPGQKLEKIGFSRGNDGREDAWSYTQPDGGARIELSSHRDGRIDRIEYYAHDVMVRAEEDTDGDGKIDKWETYDGARRFRSPDGARPARASSRHAGVRGRRRPAARSHHRSRARGHGGRVRAPTWRPPRRERDRARDGV
jgi:hypothetical protein